MTSVSATLLLSADDRARLAEVHRLAATGPQGVDPLVDHLDDSSWAVRREVIYALAQLGDAAIPAMCQALLVRRDLEARVAALVEALIASRGTPDAALLSLTTSSNPAVICDVAQILGRRQSTGAVTALSGLVDHPDDNVAVAAVEALGRIGGHPSAERLIALLGSGNFFRVFPAIDAVGRLADTRATGPLMKLTATALYTVEATRALGRIGDVRAVATLAALLGNPADSVVRAAAVALWEIHQHRFEGVADIALQAPSDWKPANPEVAARRLINASKGADRVEQVAMCHVLGWCAQSEAIAALLGFLKSEPEIAQAARSALARLGNTIDAELLWLLRTGDSVCRALVLPLLGRAQARSEVELCLSDPDPGVCSAACAALARLGDTAAVPALFALLRNDSPRVSQAAVNAILSLGSNETERLALLAATSIDPQERRGGVRIVATLGYEKGLPALLTAIEDPDERLRDIALPGLALLEGPEALDALLAASTHASSRTRTAAVRALGQAPADSRLDKVLRGALADSDPWVRYYACHSLGRRKDVGAIDLLVAHLEDEAGQVRIAAVEALSHLPGEIARQVLRTAATARDPDMRRAALLGLGLRGEADVLPTLLEAARSPEVATRLVALSALAGFKQPEAFDALVVAARDDDEGVRSAAIGMLASLGGQSATFALVGLLGDQASRAQAMKALTNPLEGRVPALLEALDRADETMAGPLATTISRIERADAAEGLVLALGSKNVAARRAVAVALGGPQSAKALSALRDAAAHDPDLEVRRLAAVTLES